VGDGSAGVAGEEPGGVAGASAGVVTSGVPVGLGLSGELVLVAGPVGVTTPGVRAQNKPAMTSKAMPMQIPTMVF
jgi:hypothetical protein